MFTYNELTELLVICDTNRLLKLHLEITENRNIGINGSLTLGNSLSKL